MNIEDCELRKVKIDTGVEIHFVEAGHGEPMVFVHGGFGDWSSWGPQWPEYSASYRCFSYSRRFSSPNNNNLSTRNHSAVDEALDLLALLDEWHLEAPVIVGTSYGAFTALELGLIAPHRVRALALSEPPVLPLADLTPGGREARIAFEQIFNLGKELYAGGRIEEAVTVLTVGINGDSPQPATSKEGLRKRMLNAYAMQVLCGSADPFPAPDIQELKNLRVPVLLTSGATTQPIHDYVFQSLSRLLPNAQAVRVPEAGHGVHRDNPAGFNAILTEFLRTLPFRRESNPLS